VPPITVMAGITLVASAALWGGLVYCFSGRDRRYLWLLLPGLPLSALVNQFVKRPLIVAVGEGAGVAPGLGLETPWWFLLFVWLVPPVTEEAIKLAPLLMPWARRGPTGRSCALWTGMALGIGFGLGEAASIAYGIARSPAYAGYPWYAFTGYLSERLIVCFCHGVMTAVAVEGLRAGWGRALGGYSAAVGLHALLNAGAMLGQLGVISMTWASLSLVVPVVLVAFIFERQRRRAGLEGESVADRTEVVYFRRDPDGDTG
jgi:hypothetical protein